MKRPLMVIMIISLMLAGCSQMGPYARDGAFIGSALGGITGAVVGHQFGRGLEGAAIGAGLGAVTGGTIGDAHDQAAWRNQAYAAPGPNHATQQNYMVGQEPVTPPPGRWVTVPGQWVGGRWVPAHKVWVPLNP